MGGGNSSSTPPLAQVEVFNSYVGKKKSCFSFFFFSLFDGDEKIVASYQLSVTVRSQEEGVLDEEGVVSPRSSALTCCLRSCSEALGTGGRGGAGPTVAMKLHQRLSEKHRRGKNNNNNKKSRDESRIHGN